MEEHFCEWMTTDVPLKTLWEQMPAVQAIDHYRECGDPAAYEMFPEIIGEEVWLCETHYDLYFRLTLEDPTSEQLQINGFIDYEN